MPLWDKVKTELDRAGRVAQQALEEGRVRLELQRARRSADAAAADLGRAVFQSRESGAELPAETYDRLAAVLRVATGDVVRFEQQLAAATAERKGDTPSPSAEPQPPV